MIPIALVTLVIVALMPADALAQKAPGTVSSAKPATAPYRFDDITIAAGIQFHLTCGSANKEYIMDSLCGGVAVLDFDGDGWMDLFFLSGSTLDAERSGRRPASKLYRNNRKRGFEDVTAKSGIVPSGWGMGVAVGDYDNDGDSDLYLTYLKGGALYRNNGDGTFTNVTTDAAVGNPDRWGTSAAFGDYDHDGFLDLYIANYVDLDLANLPAFGSGPFCQYRGIAVSCGPRGLKGSRDRLYRNQGDGTFRDVSEELKIDPDGYYGLGVIWADANGDGCLDLYVADDSSPSLFYRGDCKGGLAESGVTAGIAYSDDGREQAGMGVDFGDYDRDGRSDLVKTNFSDDTNNLYRNQGNGEFQDMAGPAGFGPVSIPFLGFGVRFLDFDNDGWKDVFIANGHVNPQVDAHAFGVSYAQRALLFHNLGGGRFEEVGLRAGAAMKTARVSRGAAVADFDNDGRLDVVVTNLDASPVLLHNSSRTGNWLRIRTVGKKSNRDGYGARVTVTTGDVTQTDEVRAGSSYVSSSDPRLHFGLGKAARVDRIVVRWPSGAEDTIQNVSANQEIVIEEGRGQISPTQPKP